jgi:hypothetical protein
MHLAVCSRHLNLGALKRYRYPSWLSLSLSLFYQWRLQMPGPLLCLLCLVDEPILQKPRPVITSIRTSGLHHYLVFGLILLPMHALGHLARARKGPCVLMLHLRYFAHEVFYVTVTQ